MLTPHHDLKRLGPVVLRAAPPTVNDALADGRGLRLVDSNRGSPGPLLHHRRMSFVRRYRDLRDGLAWRAGAGEPLSERERCALRLIDVVLDELAPRRAPLPPEVRQILDDYLGR